MKYFSMFSGIGGFELGIHRAVERASASMEVDTKRDLPNAQGGVQEGGHRATCIGFSEIDKNAIKVYELHFKGHRNYGDATAIIPEQLPDFDFLCGGFPCQAFSIAGKRLGFDDTRGTLFFEIARILKVKRPGQFLLENVKGLLSHDNGNTFKTIITTLVEMGYCVEWEVLNSKNFGVPQNRERVFIHGFRDGCGRQIFPIGSIDQQVDSGVKEASKIIDPKYLMRDCSITEHCPTMAKRDYKEPFIVAQAIKDTQRLPDAQRVREIDGQAVTLKGLGGGQGAKTGLYAIPTPNIYGVFQGYRIRRLTPVEAERLQGFPDGWTDILSDSQRYKCLGNAVTVNVIEAIISKMVAESE